MAISPIELNGMVGRTQDFSFIKQNEDNKGLIDQNNIHAKIDQKVENHLSKVEEQEDTDGASGSYDSKNGGKGQYAGDGGRHRPQKKVPDEGSVIIKKTGGFDIKI